MRLFVTMLAIIATAFLFSQDYYSQDCTLHIRKDGTAVVEISEHFYEAGFLGHSIDCPCFVPTDDFED